ncbi:MAG: 4-hydroxyphenylacetate 3-hydroxylase [Dehalococcoidia bacterium]|nr:4-hydroxyphenylacetate 3-hydroxylase [Dehalococcoidia bacterium]
MMMTGDQYRASLRDGRALFIEGERVEDPATHPLLKTAVDAAAAVYDRFYSPDPEAYSPIYIIPHNDEEQKERVEKLKGGTDMSAGTSSVSVLALATAAPDLAKAKPEYRQRIYDFIDYVRKNDLRCAEAVTDAKGNRKLRPLQQDDPDMYVHVVDRNADGVFITGCKMHISAAPIEHELVVFPTKAMRPGEEAYAISCSVPANAPGVSMINTTYAPHGEDLRHFPVSARINSPEAFIVFDRVFVPNERIFLDGETEHAATLAYALGLWERAGGGVHAREGEDRLVGLAALAAEAAGIADEPHIHDKLSTLMIFATMCRAGHEAAWSNATTNADGNLMPSTLFISATKYYHAQFHDQMVDILHDIAGALVVNAPTLADYDNPELRGVLDELFAAPGFSAEERLRLYHYIRDTTADAYGGWGSVTGKQAGGGQYAQRLVTMRNYDMERAKDLARKAVRIGNHAPAQEPVATA